MQEVLPADGTGSEKTLRPAESTKAQYKLRMQHIKLTRPESRSLCLILY